MPLRWIAPQGPTPASAQSPLVPEEPKIVLVAPGSLTPRHRLSAVLAAGSLLAVALRPLPSPQAPRALANTITVVNNNAGGPGSLFQAVHDANADAGPDTINFSPSVSGTIALTGTLMITNSVQINGPGPGVLSVSGGNTRRVFYLYNASSSPLTATITGLTIRDGATTDGGAGIRANNFNLTLDQVDLISNAAESKAQGGGLNFRTTSSITVSLTIRNSLLSGNQAATGGGIFLYRAQAGVVITNTQIVSNTAVFDGGGAYIRNTSHLLIEDSTIMSNTAGFNGGGIEAQGLDGASNTIRRTTISGNTTSGRGGGVYLFGTDAPLSIENSTISANHAGQGGGIYLYNASNISIQNSTIVSNTAATGAGGVEVEKHMVPITDTIIAGNVVSGGADISGTFQLRYDLVQITGTATITDAGGNLFGLDPLLGPLANNGGPTLTHLPAANSPVLNAGDPAFAPPPATDQRGDPRVVGGQVDIGAVELNPGAVQLSSSSYQVNEIGVTATVTVTRTGGSDGAVSVDYATGGGTAIAGTDYLTATGALNWANGDAAPKTFTVQITDDNLLDGTATVGLHLSNPQGGVQLGSPITGTLTIVDNLFTLDLPVIRRATG